MRFPILRRPVVEYLYNNVSQYVSVYERSTFDPQTEPFGPEALAWVPDTDFDPALFGRLTIPSRKNVGLIDAENAKILFDGLVGMTPNRARDERIWVAFSHFYGHSFIQKYEFSESSEDRKSLPIEDQQEKLKKRISKIKTRFFCRYSSIQRGFERDNAFSRLWWYGYLTSATRLETMTQEEALSYFCRETDFREALLARSSTSIEPKSFEACLNVFKKELESDPEVKFFTRTRDGGDRDQTYGEFFKMVNRFGGRMLFDCISVEDLTEIYWGFRQSLKAK